MAICSKCKTGFDSNLTRCPRCNCLYHPRAKRLNRSSIANFSFFFGLGIWLLAIGLPLLAIALPQFIGDISSFATSMLSIFRFNIANTVILMFYFGIILWSYADANKRGKPGILVAFLVATTPIFGLILWLIFRPSVNS